MCIERKTRRQVRKTRVCSLACAVLAVFVYIKYEFVYIKYEFVFPDEIVALKRLKMEKEKEGFPITSLREINTILKAQHPNIVTVRVSSCENLYYQQHQSVVVMALMSLFWGVNCTVPFL